MSGPTLARIMHDAARQFAETTMQASEYGIALLALELIRARDPEGFAQFVRVLSSNLAIAQRGVAR